MTSFDIGEARALLVRTPALLDAWLRGLDDAWLDADEGPGTWTPRQVLAHLIHAERTDWIPRVRHLLEHGTAVPFAPFDRAAHLRAPARPVGALLDELADARRASLDALAALEAASGGALPLERRGLHPHLGEVTLQQLLATWTAHDLGHTVQIARTMARRYREDVGSWAEYMSVMSPDPAPP